MFETALYLDGLLLRLLEVLVAPVPSEWELRIRLLTPTCLPFSFWVHWEFSDPAASLAPPQGFLEQSPLCSPWWIFLFKCMISTLLESVDQLMPILVWHCPNHQILLLSTRPKKTWTCSCLFVSSQSSSPETWDTNHDLVGHLDRLSCPVTPNTESIIADIRLPIQIIRPKCSPLADVEENWFSGSSPVLSDPLLVLLSSSVLDHFLQTRRF